MMDRDINEFYTERPPPDLVQQGPPQAPTEATMLYNAQTLLHYAALIAHRQRLAAFLTQRPFLPFWPFWPSSWNYQYLANSGWHNPGSNPDCPNPGLPNPDCSNSGMPNPDCPNPDYPNPDSPNPDCSNPNWPINPDCPNPDWQDPNFKQTLGDHQQKLPEGHDRQQYVSPPEYVEVPGPSYQLPLAHVFVPSESWQTKGPALPDIDFSTLPMSEYMQYVPDLLLSNPPPFLGRHFNWTMIQDTDDQDEEEPQELPFEPPAFSPALSPASPPALSPAESPAESRAESPAESPAKSPAGSPAKSLAESPAESRAGSPAEPPAEPMEVA